MKQKLIKNKVIILKLFSNNKPIGKRNRPFCEFEFTTEEQCNNFIKLLNSQEDYIAIGDVILKRDLITYALKEIR